MSTMATHHNTKIFLVYRITKCLLFLSLAACGEAVFELKEDNTSDGSTTVRTVHVTIEANNGTAYITINSPGKPGNMKSVATRWEYLN
jgi:hypothetical protein